MKDMMADTNRIIVLVIIPAFLKSTGKVSKAPPSVEFRIADIVSKELWFLITWLIFIIINLSNRIIIKKIIKPTIIKKT